MLRVGDLQRSIDYYTKALGATADRLLVAGTMHHALLLAARVMSNSSDRK
jgi:catechol 2,3-dioxygenase-like lactoylglutathione lyase family enzyme